MWYVYAIAKPTKISVKRVFPGGSALKNLPANAGDKVQSLGRKDSLEEQMAIHSSILAWRNLRDRQAWRATVHGLTNELDTT